MTQNRPVPEELQNYESINYEAKTLGLGPIGPPSMCICDAFFLCVKMPDFVAPGRKSCGIGLLKIAGGGWDELLVGDFHQKPAWKRRAATEASGGIRAVIVMPP